MSLITAYLSKSGRGAAILSALLLPFVVSSCANGGSADSGAATPVPTVAAEMGDSANRVAVFVDTDGRLDSIFSAHGYLFGPEIVRASQDGNSDASFILAQMYAYGIAGAKPNRIKAFKLFLNLADCGNNEALANAGYMTLYGLGTESDPSQGLDMLAKAANNGSATAYLYMGKFYSDSEPTPENKANAKLCFAQAKDLGIAEAAQLLEALGD